MRRDNNKDPWFPYLQCNPSARIRMFCLPYAGGSSLVFRNWMNFFGPDVEVRPVQLPGRGRRLHETPFASMDLLLDALGSAMSKYLDKPFVFFGHSMGAIVSFEQARRLYKERGLRVAHLFVSGRRAPHLAERTAATFDLPQAEFVQELHRLKGTPAEILENEEILNLMLPLIRSDFKLIQTYQHTPGEQLPCGITAMGGIEDEEITREDIEAWRQHSRAEFSVQMFPGGHFFLHQEEKMLLQTIAGKLDKIKKTLTVS